MKKAIIVLVILAFGALIFFWYSGHATRQKKVTYCKDKIEKAIESTDVLPFPFETYKEMFVNCLKKEGFPDIFIEKAVKENF